MDIDLTLSGALNEISLDTASRYMMIHTSCSFFPNFGSFHFSTSLLSQSLGPFPCPLSTSTTSASFAQELYFAIALSKAA
jgi:hypothetical protein